jgi:hypothetical protein
MTPRDRTASGRFRLLVIANETAEDDALHELIVDRVGGMPAEVLLVAPALRSSGDTADARVEHGVERLGERGIHAYGWVGHPDPVAAIAGALTVFEADEVIIASDPAGAVLAQRARERFGLPATHVAIGRMLAAA